MASHTTNNVPRSCSNIHSFLAPPLLMCQALYAVLIRFWPAFTFGSIVSRPCEGMMCVCVCVCGSRWWRHFRANPHCVNQNSEHTFFFTQRHVLMILLSREFSIVFIVLSVTCSHLWWGGEERQRPDPVPQLPWWLQAQQSVCVEDYCRSGLPRRPYVPVLWGETPVICYLTQ